jgi:hypothetical protein
LFEARHKPGIDRIQFALAGMNAHINHDLSLALLQTDDEFDIVPSKTSREHDDFEQVNELLGSVIPQALNKLATGIVGEVVHCGPPAEPERTGPRFRTDSASPAYRRAGPQSVGDLNQIEAHGLKIEN